MSEHEDSTMLQLLIRRQITFSEAASRLDTLVMSTDAFLIGQGLIPGQRFCHAIPRVHLIGSRLEYFAVDGYLDG